MPESARFDLVAGTCMALMATVAVLVGAYVAGSIWALFAFIWLLRGGLAR
jgi:hypothetical protein